ncbi:hypothetical protein ABB55_00645 [Prosthecomicrobium hirschii]|uniref:Uncharacterized protein n=1 Tax=Prosthecodimorpha hirschii TaxID=665126 RepID=A0A0P6VFW0_9HYPH|nr:hypothetical protein [Prosthecomicrobium hirschii]KPL50915.1 hypothetical protein ABB55_00645 [Prosthecomicrobium hirschii]
MLDIEAEIAKTCVEIEYLTALVCEHDMGHVREGRETENVLALRDRLARLRALLGADMLDAPEGEPDETS